MSRDNFDEALRIYQSGSDQALRNPELARTRYHRSKVLRRLHRTDEAETDLAKAVAFLKTGTPPDEEVFETLISPWAR